MGFIFLILTLGTSIRGENVFFDSESIDEVALGDYAAYFDSEVPVGDFDPAVWDMMQSESDEEELSSSNERPFVMSHGINHAVGTSWKGFDVEDHLFDPDVPEQTIGDEDPLQVFFDHVEKKYGSITLADVKRRADDEFPLGLEELLKPTVMRELELGQTKEKEKKDIKSIEKQMKQMEDVAKKAGVKTSDTDSLSADKRLMLRFLKKLLMSCPYKVRVEFVRRFKARYSNSEKRDIIMDTVRKFRDTMTAFVEGHSNLSEQTQRDLEDYKNSRLLEHEKERKEEEAREKAQADLERDEILKKLWSDMD